VGLAVTFYDVVKWVHVSSIVVGLGPTFAYGIYIAIASANEPRSIPLVYRVLQAIDGTFVTIGGILILLSGIYLAADRWDFGYFFVTWGVIAIIVLLGLTHGFFRPNERRAERLARRDIEASGGGNVRFSEEYNQVSLKMARMGPVAGLIVILTIYVMTAKPFL
jgi:small-conductance mechanosensitive channel